MTLNPQPLLTLNPQPSVLRVLDANANRAMEGLRVVEDYLRFVLADAHLVEVCKQLRHDLSAAVALIPLHELLAARDTSGDVGTEVTATDEFLRPDPSDIWIANQKRVEQALRCLEEFAKSQFTTAAMEFEKIRYRIYTLAKATESTCRNRERLAASRLYVLIDAGQSLTGLCNTVRMLVDAGVHVLQLREKNLADRELLERARAVRELTRGAGTQFIMNDRPDLAVLANADGVHVGQDELRVADARAVVGSNCLVGVSTHSLQQARQAVLDGADYIGCGPTFLSNTKTFTDFPGLELLRQVAAEITLPVFAIGGINSDNAPDVLSTGISRLAVGAAVSQSSNPDSEVRRFLELLSLRHGS